MQRDIDGILRENEKSVVIYDDVIAKINFAQLTANDPCEDHCSSAKCLSSDSYFVGVFDGHGGKTCSQHVSTRLFDYLSTSELKKHGNIDLPSSSRMQWIHSNSERELSPLFRKKHIQNLDKYVQSMLGSGVLTVKNAIQAAFVAMDDDMFNDICADIDGIISKEHIDIATSGSCGIVAHIRKNHLHVANVGDSIAVVGTMKNGSISAHLLSKVHSCNNMDEVRRIRQSHPVSELGTVIQFDRLLGELYPLRAFGDYRYKWTRKFQESFLTRFGVTGPQNLLTPPYLTALPEVFYYLLSPNDQFLIIASDGLWEWLDPDTVVRLVYDHNIGSETVMNYVPGIGNTLDQVAEALEKKIVGNYKKPLDDNSATHLIRLALGGCTDRREKQYSRLNNFLKVPPGRARNDRDDISVIVIHFNQKYLQDISKNSSQF